MQHLSVCFVSHHRLLKFVFLELLTVLLPRNQLMKAVFMEAVLPNHPGALLLSSLFKVFKGCLLGWPHHNGVTAYN